MTVPREMKSLPVRVLRTSGLVWPQRSLFEGRGLGDMPWPLGLSMLFVHG